ncbi:MAG: histidine kinase [Halieaceae bacterium]
MNIDHLFEDKRAQFWGLQLLGWTGWGVTFYVAAMVWGAPPGYGLYVPIVSLIGLSLSLVMRVVYKRSWDMIPRHRLAIAIVTSYLAGAAWMMSRSFIFMNMFEPKKKMPDLQGLDHFFYRLENVSTAWMVMLCWTALYFGIKYYRLLQEERQRGLKTQAMAHEAQLKMLRYQLNPHFLFNTLNAISTLILDKEGKLANTMVTRLSHFLRYSLDNDPMQKVSLAQEIEAMKLYLDIEKVRFDERLRLAFEVDREAEQALIPSLLLQPLVENAIKYAIAQSVNGGAIRIAAKVFAGDLLMEVSDDGPGMEPGGGSRDKRNGVGLVNTRERLQELYGANHSFQLGKTEPHGLTISIRIPLEQKD